MTLRTPGKALSPGFVGADLTLRLPVPESKSQIQTRTAKTKGEGRKEGLLRPHLLVLSGYPSPPSHWSVTHGLGQTQRA